MIIYTSKNGRTDAMVDPIRQGMLDGRHSVEVPTVEEVQWDEMLAAQCIIVGTPMRFGDLTGRSSGSSTSPALQDYPGPLSGKVGGAFTGGGRPGI